MRDRAEREAYPKGLVGMYRRAYIVIVLFGILGMWLLVFLRWPAYQVLLLARAGEITLALTAWWLAGRVLAGK